MERHGLARPLKPPPFFQESQCTERLPSKDALQQVRRMLSKLDQSKGTWTSEDLEAMQLQPVAVRRRRKRKPVQSCDTIQVQDDLSEQDMAANCLLLMLQSDTKPCRRRRCAKKATHKRSSKGGLSAVEAVKLSKERRARKGNVSGCFHNLYWKRLFPLCGFVSN
jgi:hypothetical protein